MRECSLSYEQLIYVTIDVSWLGYSDIQDHTKCLSDSIIFCTNCVSVDGQFIECLCCLRVYYPNRPCSFLLRFPAKADTVSHM